jgi:hypothetical protein
MRNEELCKMVEEEGLKTTGSGKLVNDLQPGSYMLRDLEDFATPGLDLQRIVTCFEQLETPTVEKQAPTGTWARTGEAHMMVERESSNLNWPNETRTPIYANHSEIAKLNDNHGSAYYAVRDEIANHINKAPGVVKKRQTIPIQHRILRKVTHRDDKYMRTRRSQIHDADRETCGWILEYGDDKAGDHDSDRVKTSKAFRHWLRKGQNIQHISGNPGAGKSTLVGISGFFRCFD